MSKSKYTLDKIQEIGFNNGFVFGKYTLQTQIDDELQKILDNNKQAIVSYMSEFNKGFNAGIAEAHRSATLEEIEHE